MKKIVFIVLVFLILIPSFSFANNTLIPMDRYVDFLVYVMDGDVYIDYDEFEKNPEVYYFKALELGLANLYIPYDATVSYDIAYSIMEKAVELGLEVPGTSNIIGVKEVHHATTPENFSHVKMGYNFNSDFFGSFEGRLTGIDDFTGFKIQLLSRNGKLLKEFNVGKDGRFDLSGFDISLVAKLLGYKYEVYSPQGELVKKNNLS